MPISQDTTTYNAKPTLDVIEPGAVRRSVVKDKTFAVTAIPLGHELSLVGVFVRVQIVQDDMDPSLTADRRNIVHE